MKKLLSKIGRFLVKQNKEAIEEEYYMPKLFGEGKTVEYEIDGMKKSFCKLTQWANGEGYDVSFESEVSKGRWENKRIELHTDELDVFFACLNHFKYFGK
jgi:hypothetical protein